MTKNEIVSKWAGFDTPVANWNFDDYNFLHRQWVKFRDLKFDHGAIGKLHDEKCDIIAHKITHGTITEAFDELMKAIEWYNSLNK